MKQWIGWGLLALSLFITYQGWRNSQPQVQTEDMSKSAACEGKSDCTVEGQKPQKIATDFLARDYEWRTSAGPVSVRCQRAYVFLGAWACRAGS